MKKIIALSIALVTFLFILLCATSETILTSGDLQIDTDINDPPVESNPPVDPDSTSITLTKTVNGQLWRIRCDYMDGTTFHAGGGIWRRDWIMNPSGLTSKEGHRSNKCGDAEHWVIWTDLDGIPYRMDEIKSGATGGTLPTVVYYPDDPMTEEEILLMGDDYPELIEKYKRNFQHPMPYSEIKIGVRQYWITWNGKQIWYHTGIPYAAEPSFIITINGTPHILTSGQSVEITDLEPGIYEISEEANPLYTLGKVISTEGTIQTEDGWSITIEIKADEHTNIEWPNLQPDPTDSKQPPNPPSISPTPTPTPTPSPSPTPVINIEGYKIWDDENNLYRKRPKTIIIKLYANEELVDSKEIYASENDAVEAMWSYIFENLPFVDENGNEIIYSIKEDIVKGYESHYRGLNIINSYITPTLNPILTETPAPTLAPMATPNPTATPTPTPIPTPTPDIEWIPPTIPEDQPQPSIPEKIWHRTSYMNILDYDTALGLQLTINHIGDSFD